MGVLDQSGGEPSVGGSGEGLDGIPWWLRQDWSKDGRCNNLLPIGSFHIRCNKQHGHDGPHRTKKGKEWTTVEHPSL